jgi:quercetin dioxygenase-like cupin family protein
MSAAEAVTTVDDDQVRVTTWTFPEAGASTGTHVHEHDYVVVPVTGGTFRVTMADGSLRELRQDAGVPYRGVAGTAHEVSNGGDGPAVFVEAELKEQPTAQGAASSSNGDPSSTVRP